MAGYAASARITHASPHQVRRGVDSPGSALGTPTIVDGDTSCEEVSGQPFLAPLTDWWDDVREIWRQGMDVLRDPRIY